jgi:hypothetical protein
MGLFNSEPQRPQALGMPPSRQARTLKALHPSHRELASLGVVAKLCPRGSPDQSLTLKAPRPSPDQRTSFLYTVAGRGVALPQKAKGEAEPGVFQAEHRG